MVEHQYLLKQFLYVSLVLAVAILSSYSIMKFVLIANLCLDRIVLLNFTAIRSSFVPHAVLILISLRGYTRALKCTFVGRHSEQKAICKGYQILAVSG